MSLFTKMERIKEVYWVVGIIGVALVTLLIVFTGNSESQFDDPDSISLDTLLADDRPIDLNDGLSSSDISTESAVHDVVVDVKGAVRKPGVFSLTSSQRVIDAIEAADGLTADADVKYINFAQLLEDEMFIYIPVEGEERLEIGGGSEVFSTEGDKVNINKATEQMLLQLNGIGPSKANEIIKFRDTNGPFKVIGDITKVSGIGEKTFEKIEEFIDVK